METIEVIRDGLRLVGPKRPKRNDYVRVSVTVLDDRYEPQNTGVSAHHPASWMAWDSAVALARDIYGSTATEDGTIGQHAQCEGSDGSKRMQPAKGRVFSLGLNLYGRKIKPIWARIDAANDPGRLALRADARASGII